MSILTKLGNRAKSLASNPTARKIGLGVAGAAVAGAAAYGAYRFFKGHKKRSSTSKLTAQVKRKTLKLQSIKLDRKIFREQMKGI